MDDATFEKMRKVQESHHARLMRIPGVHGTSIGHKIVHGESTDTLAIIVHLTKKKPLSELPENERIPKEIGGFPTDIIEHDQPEANEDNSKRRPVLGGIQLAIEAGFAHANYGTLGCIVRARTNNTLYALTNQHVLQGTTGDVCQPKVDASDVIGTKIRMVLSSDVDGGLSSLDVAPEASIVDLGNVTGSYVVTSKYLPYPVKKRGRTTLVTHGKIWSLSYRGVRNDGWNFTGQQFILTDGGDFSRPGDSGSAVVDSQMRVVGLLWGSAGPNGVASPIDKVMAQLDIMVAAGPLPEVLPYEATTLGKLEALLSQSTRGRGYWKAFRSHGGRVQHLFHHTPRLYAVWRKTPGTELMEAIRKAVANPDSRVPSKIGGHNTVEVLTKLHNALKRYVKEDVTFKQQIDSLYRDIVDNIGVSWRKALSDAKAAPEKAKKARARA
jgi:hypothetical protein